MASISPLIGADEPRAVLSWSSGSRASGLASVEAIALELGVEKLAVNTQPARGSGAIAAALGHGTPNHFPLEPLQGRRELAVQQPIQWPRGIARSREKGEITG